MAKELYFNETDCENLNVLNILPKETALELWKMSLQILDSNHNLSSKQLTKAASKIATTAEILEKTLSSLASIFLKATMCSKTQSQTKSSFELLGIPYAEDMAMFWSNEVHTKIRNLFLKLLKSQYMLFAE